MAASATLYVDGGVSRTGDVGHVRMKGNEVFRHAVEKLSASLDSGPQLIAQP